MALPKYRAVEHRRFLARAGNQDGTVLIDPAGRVVGELERGRPGRLLGDARWMPGLSFYDRVGDGLWFLVALALALMTLVRSAEPGGETRRAQKTSKGAWSMLFLRCGGWRVNVKALGLLNVVRWVRENLGEEAYERLLEQCSPVLRARCASVAPGEWIPQGELVEMLYVAERSFGTGDGKLAEAAGALSARANLRHLALRLAFFLARPEFMMRRVAGVWREYNDEGEMLVRSFADGHMLAELEGLTAPDWLFCATLSGWWHEAGRATGMTDLVTRHTQCRGRDAARCLWELTWTPRRS